jgi:hypothetical protein
MAEVSFPAAPTPPGVRTALRAGGVVALVLVGWGALVVRGTGVGGFLGLLLLACAVPAVWALAMRPHAYSIAGDEVIVHRRWLPDSRFRIRSAPERLHVHVARSPEGADDPRDRIARLHRERVYKALTDTRKGVRVPIARGNALLISPDDPDAFVRAGAGGGFR